MIKNAYKISVDAPEFRAAFQQEVLDHWQTIAKGQQFPCKKEFRPQLFPHFLGQFAIISVSENHEFSDRLTGGIVCDVLKLPDGPKKLMAPPDTNVRETLFRMFREMAETAEPMYYTGRFTPNTRPPIEFSALALPFAEKAPCDKLESILFAFDFTKHATTNLFAAS